MLYIFIYLAHNTFFPQMGTFGNNIQMISRKTGQIFLIRVNSLMAICDVVRDQIQAKTHQHTHIKTYIGAGKHK